MESSSLEGFKSQVDPALRDLVGVENGQCKVHGWTGGASRAFPTEMILGFWDVFLLVNYTFGFWLLNIGDEDTQ